MDHYLVKGGRPLEGTLPVQGAKNAALPILAASLLSDGCRLSNCPRLSDVTAACHILEELGCPSHWEEDGCLVIENCQQPSWVIPERLMHEMRSSIVFLGAMLGRFRRASLSFPGGCELGPRPIDLHLASLEKLGVRFHQDRDRLEADAPEGLHGANIQLPFPSVGATENVMLAACLAQGETVLRNAAREPEIGDLAAFLVAAGGDVTLEGDGTIRIRGVKELRPCDYRVMPDRIVGITYLCCGAITGGTVRVENCCPDHMQAVFPILEEMGCDLTLGAQEVSLTAPKQLQAVKNITTMPYPGFPTDALAPVMALSCVARGTTVFTETIFQNRYKQAWELCRMGAEIRCEGRIAVVRGVKALHPASVSCTDLRGGAALVIAALAAPGLSTIHDIRHIQRGYEDLPQVLSQAGACIYSQ